MASASDSSKNTLRAPFPRTNATSRPTPPTRRQPLTSSASASKPAAPDARAPNRRLSAPSSGIAGSMGPPPPAGRRNERFDRLFYTSPLPRSISREYNNLRASHTPATANMTAAPSALREGISADGNPVPTKPVPIATEVIKASLSARISPRGKVVTETVAETRATQDDEDELSAPAAAAVTASASSPKIRLPAVPTTTPRTTRLTKLSPRAPAIAAPPVDEDVYMRTMSDSEDPTQPSANPFPPSERTKKRTHSQSPPPPSPKKLLKTAAAPSPVEVRSTRSARRQIHKSPVVDTNTKPKPKEKAPRPPPEDTPEKHKNERATRDNGTRLRHRRASLPPTLHSSQLPTTATAPKKHPTLITGFQIPPGILDETGSLWDPHSGRRHSRRVSAVTPRANSIMDTHVKSLVSGGGKQRRNSVSGPTTATKESQPIKPSSGKKRIISPTPNVPSTPSKLAGKTILGANMAEWEENGDVGVEVSVLGSGGRALGMKMRKSIVPFSAQKKRGADWVVSGTPQPQPVQGRVTRGSAAKGEGVVKGMGVQAKGKGVINPEFEFSDDE